MPSTALCKRREPQREERDHEMLCMVGGEYSRPLSLASPTLTLDSSSVASTASVPSSALQNKLVPVTRLRLAALARHCADEP